MSGLDGEMTIQVKLDTTVPLEAWSQEVCIAGGVLRFRKHRSQGGAAVGMARLPLGRGAAG